jgi:hypothetical protein
MLSVNLKDSGLVLCSLAPTRASTIYESLSPLDLHLSQLEIILPPRDWYHDIGHDIEIAEGVDKLVFYGSKPTELRDFPGSSRHERASEYLSYLRAFFSDWNFGNGFSSSTDGENPIHHFNLRGNLFSGTWSENIMRSGYPRYNTSYDVLPNNYVLTETLGCPVITLSEYSPLYLEILGNLPFENFLLSQEVQGGEWDLETLPYPYTFIKERFYESFLMNTYLGYRPASIHVVHRKWSFGTYHTQYLTAIRRIYMYKEKDYNPPLNTVETLDHSYDTSENRCIIEWHQIFYGPLAPEYDAWEIYKNSFLSSYKSTAPLSYYNECYDIIPCAVYFATNPEYSDIGGMIGSYNGTYVNNHSRSFEAFRQNSVRIAPDCYSMVFFSSKDAIDNFIDGTKANNLENLSQIGDLFGLVDVYQLLRTVKQLRKIKGISLLVTLLNLLSEAKLIYSFAIAPSLADANDIAEKAASLRRTLFSSELLREKTVYGNAVFDVPEELRLDFQGMFLEVRSKLRFRINPDSYLSSMLPWKSLGLLPSLSNLWEVIPLSFLVDWATNLGPNVENLEMSAMFMAVDVKTSIHSVNLYYPFEQDLLDAHNISGFSEGTGVNFAGYKFYDRFKLKSIPTLMPTRFPAFASAVPSWSTAGALFYQLIKS